MKTLFLTLLLTSLLTVTLFAQADNTDLLKKFNTTDKAAAGKKFAWAGTWKYRSRYSPSTITIMRVTATRFDFEIESMTGANIGSIYGTARIKGNKAYFDDRADKTREEREGCRLLFTHKGASMELDQSSECSYYGGAGVSFERGKFLKGNPPYLEKDFSQHEIFAPGEDAKFKALAGQADYDNFLSAFHLVTEEENPGDVSAKVWRGCIRGACSYNTAIIMIGDGGKFWAAVNASDAKKEQVHYYTNVPAWAGKLPAAISAWHKENVPEIPVIYMNKK